MHRTTFTLCSVSCLCQYQRLRKVSPIQSTHCLPIIQQAPNLTFNKGAASPRIRSAPKSSSRHFLFLSVLMLCAHVFIFTSGSPALLGCPHCGLWVCRYLPYSIHFSEFMPIIFFTRKRTKHENTRSPPFSYDDRRRLLGAQSIKIDICCCCCCCCVSFFLLKNNPTVNLTVCLGD